MRVLFRICFHCFHWWIILVNKTFGVVKNKKSSSARISKVIPNFRSYLLVNVLPKWKLFGNRKLQQKNGDIKRYVYKNSKNYIMEHSKNALELFKLFACIVLHCRCTLQELATCKVYLLHHKHSVFGLKI